MVDPAVDVITVVEAGHSPLWSARTPAGGRSDNGPEFIAYCIQDSWENGHIDSFHDKLRDECLNRELFGNLREVRVILESWRVEYNERRPHSALGYRTPNEYAGTQ